MDLGAHQCPPLVHDTRFCCDLLSLQLLDSRNEDTSGPEEFRNLSKFTQLVGEQVDS